MWSFSDEKTEDQDETDAQSKSSDVVGADKKDAEVETKEPETEQPDDVKQSGQGKKHLLEFIYLLSIRIMTKFITHHCKKIMHIQNKLQNISDTLGCKSVGICTSVLYAVVTLLL